MPNEGLKSVGIVYYWQGFGKKRDIANAILFFFLYMFLI